MPPFEKMNYALRPNKNVERKLIVESLSSLSKSFNLSSYQYIGFGSMWFVDFVLVHKYLQIENMFSIERPENAKRADFNKPFNCITVVPCESSEALTELHMNSIPSIIWLDYEDGLDGPVLDDIKIVCQMAKSGTILIVTANASLSRLAYIYKTDENGNAVDKETIIRRLGKDLIPQTLPSDALRNNLKKNKGFPRFLTEILFSHAKRIGNVAGRVERFQPLFNFFYQDGAPMVTIGGMIADDNDKLLLDECKLFEKFEYLKEEQLYVIDIPPLTAKEKIFLDLMLPCPMPPAAQDVSEKGFDLKQQQIDSYHKLYKFYPMFGEVAIG